MDVFEEYQFVSSWSRMLNTNDSYFPYLQSACNCRFFCGHHPRFNSSHDPIHQPWGSLNPSADMLTILSLHVTSLYFPCIFPSLWHTHTHSLTLGQAILFNLHAGTDMKDNQEPFNSRETRAS